MTAPMLRETIVELLSRPSSSPVPLPIVIPDVLDHDVLRWGYEFNHAHHLFHVRAEVIVAWNISPRPRAPRQRGPLPFAASITAWLASVSEAELGSVTPARPMAFIARAPIAECAFAGFAVVHPSVAKHRVLRDDDTIIPARSYLVFPCHRSEIARHMDADWASLHKAQLGWSDLERERASAVRAVRHARAKKKAPERKPIRSRDAKGFVSQLRATGDVVELENWDRRVLRFAGGTVTLLPDGPTRALSGRGDAEALVAAFIDDNRYLEAPAPPDVLVDLGAQLEASCGDVEGGVEPVFLDERVTGKAVARLWVLTEARTLVIAYELLDARLDDTRVVELVTGPYLRVFARNWHRGKIDTLRLSPRAGGPTREVPFA